MHTSQSHDTLELSARERCALSVLGIVSTHLFGSERLVEDLLHGDAERRDGESLAVAAERLVRENAHDAESADGVRSGHTVSATLADHYLLDDYLRMKTVEQAYAFGDDLDELEEQDQRGHLEQVAEAAETSALRRREQDKLDRLVCSCGRTRSMHVRRERWETRDRVGSGACYWFVNVEDLPLRGVKAEYLLEALDAWWLNRDLEPSAPAREVARAALVKLREEQGGLGVSETFEVVTQLT